MSGRYNRGNSHSLRLSKTNPQHIKVNKILKDLNLEIIKSKNQYIIDAVEFYTKALGDEALLDKTLEGFQNNYITKQEIEEIKKDLIKEVQEKMMGLFASFTGQVIASSASITERGEQGKEKSKIDLIEDDALGDLVSKWA